MKRIIGLLIATIALMLLSAKADNPQNLKQTIAQTNNSSPSDLRVLVLIPEQVIRRQVPDPAAETEIARVLIQNGFRVVDVKQTERLEAREETASVLRGGSKQALIDLSLKFSADVLVTGEAFAEEVVPIPDELRKNGLRGYQARLEVKIIDLANAQVLLSKAWTGNGIAAADFIAGKTALENTARKAAPEIARALQQWTAGVGPAPRVFVLRVTGVPSFDTYNDLVKRLRTITGISRVKSRQYDSNGGELEITFQGSVDDLAETLSNAAILTITSINAGEIRASYK